MSLIAWYPFTKDLKNKGLSNISEYINSGVSLVNSNQFGTCVNFDGTTNGNILLNNFPAEEAFGQTTWSLSFWINFKNDTNRGIILGSLTRDSGNINFEINGNSHTDNALRIYWYKGGNNLNYSSTLLISANEWTQVCMTYDGTKLKFYKNGELVDTKSANLIYSEVIGNWYLGRDSRNSNVFLGELHDFRIYNHTLSTKEIKELAKGLILHHDLKGFNSQTDLEFRTIPSAYTQLEYIEGTGTQYIDTGYIHKATTRIDMVCNVSLNNVHTDYVALFGSRKETYRYNDFSFYATRNYAYTPCYARTGAENSSSGLLYNEKILISAYDKTCTWYKYGSTTAIKTITSTGTPDNGFNHMTLFCINKSATADGFTWDRLPANMKLYGCKIWDDNGTTLVRDFIPAMRKSDMKIGLYDAVNDVFYTNAGTGEFLTSPDIIEDDLSGNGFNGTRQGVTFTPDSPRYYMSMESDTTKDFILDRIFHQGDEVTNLSVSIWANFTTSYTSGTNNCFWNLNENYFLRVERTGNNEIKVVAAIGDSGYQYFSILSRTITLNTWHHFVLTFDNGIIKFYMNGNLETTSDKTSVGTYLKCRTDTSRWSLGDYTQTNNKFTGKLSDFRIYAKTLTADEVKGLYQTSALIDKSGKMYCGEFVEE